MREITNEPLIKRNIILSKALSAAGLLVLISGLVVSFVRPDLSILPFYTLVTGFLLSNVGMYMNNRYTREPRPDLAISKALKGLDDRYRIYHYRLPATHTLIGPQGVYAIVTKFQGGKIWWDHKRKRLAHQGTSLFRRIFAQESLGNPIAEAGSEAQRLAKYLGRHFGDEAPPVFPLIVFTNPKIEIGELKNIPVPVLKAKRLNPYLRKLGKGDGLSDKQLVELEKQLNL